MQHLMTDPKGNSEFCLLEILNVPRGEARPAIKCFVMLPNSKIEENCENVICLTPAGTRICRGVAQAQVVVSLVS